MVRATISERKKISLVFVPHRPNLNALDYSLLKILDSVVLPTPCQNIKTFKKIFNKCWEKIPLNVGRIAISYFPKRLCGIMKAQSKHFE